ncbi:hypothetical protein J2129_002771 [Methanofollis sp. W23]|nr:hypothetical protein [Methanofollis sp. W23]
MSSKSDLSARWFFAALIASVIAVFLMREMISAIAGPYGYYGCSPYALISWEQIGMGAAFAVLGIIVTWFLWKGILYMISPR